MSRAAAIAALAVTLLIGPSGCETDRRYRGDRAAAAPMKTDPLAGNRLMTGSEFRELKPTERSVEQGGLDGGYFRTPRRR